MSRGLTDRGPALPVLVPWRWKWPAGAAACAVGLSAYAIPNQFHLLTPRTLPLTWVDRAVPFMPWTVWIYWSGVLFLPAVYAVNRCLVSLNKHLYSFLALVATSSLLFLMFPTTYPRALFPIPAGTDGMTLKALELLRSVDDPSNCAPSLHVSIAYLVAFGFLEDRIGHPWLFLLFLGWATAMSISTMTVKQHYAFDVVAGLAMAVVFYRLFHVRMRYRLPAVTPGAGPARLPTR